MPAKTVSFYGLYGIGMFLQLRFSHGIGKGYRHAHVYVAVTIAQHLISIAANHSLSTLQVPPLKFPLQLKWRRGPDMPFRMTGSVQSIVMQGRVYVGGGLVGVGSYVNYIVMEYNITSEKWSKLPPYRALEFAMAVIKNQLVLVGGSESGGHSSKVGVLRTESKKWTHPYPEMPTARSQCSAVFYNEWLVVAGGMGDGDVRLSSVEVMNTDTKQWCASPPTLAPWRSMKTAIVDDSCFFMGGYTDAPSLTTKVYSVSLPGLISQLCSGERSKHDVWKEIPGLQTTCSTPLSINGSLLAVGGMDKDGKPVPAIHLYQPDNGEWVKVGDLPTPRHDCTCAMVAEREILVTGGCDRQKKLVCIVDIAVIMP